MPVGEPLQLYEIAMLILLLLGFVPVTIQFIRYRCKWFYSAYLLFIVAAVFTNLEAFYIPTTANYLEHGAMLTASFLFWMTAYQSAEAVVNADAHDVLSEVLPTGLDT